MKSNLAISAKAVKRDTVFVGNRSMGKIALAVSASGGINRRRRVAEEGCLRARFPTPEGDALEAVIVNTAGGIAGGDHHALDITVEENSRLVVTTASAEKVYRSLGPNAEIETKLKIETGGHLSWLPQEMILFDRSRLSRRIDVELSGNASAIIAETVVFGRAAMEELIETGSFVDRWRVRRDGRLLFAETVKLDGMISQTLAKPAVAAGGAAIATVLIVPGADAMVEKVRALQSEFIGEVGISTWNGFALARLCAMDSASLRRDLVLVLTALDAPLPRIWLN